MTQLLQKLLSLFQFVKLTLGVSCSSPLLYLTGTVAEATISLCIFSCAKKAFENGLSVTMFDTDLLQCYTAQMSLALATGCHKTHSCLLLHLDALYGVLACSLAVLLHGLSLVSIKLCSSVVGCKAATWTCFCRYQDEHAMSTLLVTSFVHPTE